MKLNSIGLFNFWGIGKSRRAINDPSVDRNIIISGKQVSVGRCTYGCDNITILWGEYANITIGRFCCISSRLKLYCGGNHRADWISTFPFGHTIFGGTSYPFENIKPVKGHPKSNGDISIGNDVWIGSDVTILSGVTVGDGSVLAANSHVVSDVAPYTIVGGNPGKKIAQRFSDEIINRLLTIAWWHYPLEIIERLTPFLCNQNDQGVSENLSQIERLLQDIQ